MHSVPKRPQSVAMLIFCAWVLRTMKHSMGMPFTLHLEAFSNVLQISIVVSWSQELAGSVSAFFCTSGALEKTKGKVRDNTYRSTTSNKLSPQ